MKELKIVIPVDADYSEIVDSVADLLEAGIIVEEALKDGFQFNDLLAAIQVQPTVQEIINDIPVFWEQFNNLSPTTATSSVLEARARVKAGGKPFGKVTNFIIRFLYIVANNYSFIGNTYLQGQSQYLLWQSLIKGGKIFPDEADQTPISPDEPIGT